MTARIVTGFSLADSIQSHTRSALETLRQAGAPRPVLALMLSEGQPAALAYARRLQEFATAVDITVSLHPIAQEATLQQVLNLVDHINADPLVAGILPLLPMPSAAPLQSFVRHIDPFKDVDGLHPLNTGLCAAGVAAHVPATALAAVKFAETLLGDLRGVVATVVGASRAVGRPLAQCLLERGATVTIAHIDTRDLVAACQSAELLCVAVGKAHLIGRPHIRPDSVILDIGINALPDPRNPNGPPLLVGDVDLDSALDRARCISAVPDGVGPVTAAQLMANVAQAALWLHAR